MKAAVNEFNLDERTRLALLEQSINNISVAMSDMRSELKDLRIGMIQGFDRMDSRIDAAVNKLDSKLDSKLDALSSRMWTNHFWYIGGFVGVMGLLAHSFHWI